MELIRIVLLASLAMLTSATYHRRPHPASRRQDNAPEESKPDKPETTGNVQEDVPVLYVDQYGNLRQATLRQASSRPHDNGGHGGGGHGAGGHGSGSHHPPGYHPPTLGYQGIVPYYAAAQVSGVGPLLPVAGNVDHPGGPHHNGYVYAVPYVPVGVHPQPGPEVPIAEVPGPYPGTVVPGMPGSPGMPLSPLSPLIQLFQRPFQFIGMLLRPPPNRPVVGPTVVQPQGGDAGAGGGLGGGSGGGFGSGLGGGLVGGGLGAFLANLGIGAGVNVNGGIGSVGGGAGGVGGGLGGGTASHGVVGSGVGSHGGAGGDVGGASGSHGGAGSGHAGGVGSHGGAGGDIGGASGSHGGVGGGHGGGFGGSIGSHGDSESGIFIEGGHPVIIQNVEVEATTAKIEEAVATEAPAVGESRTEGLAVASGVDPAAEPSRY